MHKHASLGSYPPPTVRGVVPPPFPWKLSTHGKLGRGMESCLGGSCLESSGLPKLQKRKEIQNQRKKEKHENEKEKNPQFFLKTFIKNKYVAIKSFGIPPGGVKPPFFEQRPMFGPQ